MKKRIALASAATVAVLGLASGTSSANGPSVVLVEPGHTLSQIVDSAVPLHPSQTGLDTLCSFGDEGNIESIGIDKATGTLYVQVSSGGFTG